MDYVKNFKNLYHHVNLQNSRAETELEHVTKTDMNRSLWHTLNCDVSYAMFR
jgi:hypothetical protein